jgi:hypothetical protein
MKKTASLVLIAFLVGCSTASKDIVPAYVSPITYSNYDCDQLRSELIRVNTRVAQITGKLDKNRENDNWTTGVAIVVFFPALLFLGGTKEQEAEYARLRGEAQTVEQVSIQKRCGFERAPDQPKVDTAPVKPEATPAQK